MTAHVFEENVVDDDCGVKPPRDGGLSTSILSRTVAMTPPKLVSIRLSSSYISIMYYTFRSFRVFALEMNEHEKHEMGAVISRHTSYIPIPACRWLHEPLFVM